jgi:hypothetical protein
VKIRDATVDEVMPAPRFGPVENLDEAWRRAEAALPTTTQLSGVLSLSVLWENDEDGARRFGAYKAETSLLDQVTPSYGVLRGHSPQGRGVTPVAAMIALLNRLPLVPPEVPVWLPREVERNGRTLYVFDRLWQRVKKKLPGRKLDA